ncbi:tRNA 2-thiouridine(34) synthase MnmA [Chitinivibrio alkaliphilus]|uniref:tRNA-specific 2-thiouridylase MnmA n=1 Tax=Chitinivibrio alkaliphilus ACht1 TaxID=1313304 RepID=U7D7K7_9BACT|nr:tRNA 2-thiouridine(34) synthase MnmA [Chitinivibrio alkaliphilus]ERP31082.1 tRNA (5-methylaminomethyl-2-thiouridylate)-methyltransferase [Chitinivibrio alkaliphilus ACht1]
MPEKRLVAAMSGGVDSSVAAALYAEQGYEVIGITLKMKNCDNSREKTKACCGLDDNIHARLAAEKLGIKHYFLDLRHIFEESVLRYAWEEYSRGHTPNPCVMCNEHLKFGALIDYADKLNADGVITGHYARITTDESGSPALLNGVDDTKNQTYFLATLTRKQLEKSCMPLGEYTKDMVREMARKRGLENAEKTESQDACFGYRGEAFAETLGRYFDASFHGGEMVDETGRFLRHHEGIQRYTIGQRKGLGVALGKPAYVSSIDPATGRIRVTTRQDDLLSPALQAESMNWLVDMPHEFSCYAQIRYNQTPVPVQVVRRGDNGVRVVFEEPVRAATAGQLLALYEKDRLLGGGWICHVE